MKNPVFPARKSRALTHRRYEALAGYLYEGLPIEDAATRAG